jgi:hypothetical protein
MQSIEDYADKQIVGAVIANLLTVTLLLIVYLAYHMISPYLNCLLFALLLALALQHSFRNAADSLLRFIEKGDNFDPYDSLLLAALRSTRSRGLIFLLHTHFFKLCVLSGFSTLALYVTLALAAYSMLDLGLRLLLSGLRSILRPLQLAESDKGSLRKICALLLTCLLVAGLLAFICVEGLLVLLDLYKLYGYLKAQTLFLWQNTGLQQLFLEHAGTFEEGGVGPLLAYLNASLVKLDILQQEGLRACLGERQEWLFYFGEELGQKLSLLYCGLLNAQEKYHEALQSSAVLFRNLVGQFGGVLLRLLSAGSGLIAAGSNVLSQVAIFFVSFYYLVQSVDHEQFISLLPVSPETHQELKRQLGKSTRGIVASGMRLAVMHQLYALVLLDAFQATDGKFLVSVGAGLLALFPLCHPVLALVPVGLIFAYHEHFLAAVLLPLLFWHFSATVFEEAYSGMRISNPFFVGLSVFLGFVSFGSMGVIWGPTLFSLINLTVRLRNSQHPH